ncbi:MAG: hypothetical protein KJ069_06305 [Anaerolineae bacterium]|nr:hypothetical protein [Anaerolineae bacterium]
MSSAIVALPVTVEQIAQAIRQMNVAERMRLLELVPELQEKVGDERDEEEARISLVELQTEVNQLFAGKKLAIGDPFIGDLSLHDYLSLPEEERQSLWEKLADDNAWLDTIKEKDVRPDALLAR